jgi:lysophospholipase L1-like esterase
MKCLVAAALIAFLPNVADPPRVFEFGPGGNAEGRPPYDAERGFGFEPGEPDAFSIAVEEGNYRVTLELLTSARPKLLRVRAEQRRLMLENGRVARGKPRRATFVVNVRTASLGPLPANASGGTEVHLKPREIGARNWDGKLTLSFDGDAAAVRSVGVEPLTVPTLYLAGDSTVTDQPVAPNGSWGQMLPRFFDDTIAVANHAESGETLKSFVTELRFDKLLSKLGAGDWVMIQFAHNDQKTQWPQTYADAANTYRSWLRTYVAEIRRRGATPIFVTSPDRRNFDAAGRITSTLGDYPESMRTVAREQGVALIDLNAMSRRFYEALGPEVAPRAFADGGRDKTHFDEYGGYQLARCVVEALRAVDPKLTASLETHLAADAGRFDPGRPDPPPPEPRVPKP